MRPQRGRNGKATLNDARMPGDVDIRTQKGVLVLPGPVYGAWDISDDDDIRQFSTRGLLGRRDDDTRDGDPGTGTGPATDSAAQGADAGSGVGSAGAAVPLDHPGTLPAARSDGRTGAPPHQRKLTKTEVKIRRQTQTALALRAEGWSLDDIAAHFAVARPTITGWLVAHRRQVTTEDIDSLLDETAVPLAAENLIHGLLEGDKDYTLEVLKGRGAFRRHGEVDKAPSTALPELRIVFEAPAGAHLPITATGHIIGTAAVPKQIEGRVVESHPLDIEVDSHAGVGQVQVPRAAESVEGAGR